MSTLGYQVGAEHVRQRAFAITSSIGTTRENRRKQTDESTQIPLQVSGKWDLCSTIQMTFSVCRFAFLLSFVLSFFFFSLSSFYHLISWGPQRRRKIRAAQNVLVKPNLFFVLLVLCVQEWKPCLNYTFHSSAISIFPKSCQPGHHCQIFLTLYILLLDNVDAHLFSTIIVSFLINVIPSNSLNGYRG